MEHIDHSSAESKGIQVQRFITATGWRRLTGYHKLQVIFRKRATNYRALLRKITYGDKAFYDSTPPYTHRHVDT